jgi:hypothetical protein
MEYCLTDEDVRWFLASKQDDESVGQCACWEQCLLAQVVREKYPGVLVSVYDGVAELMGTGVGLPLGARVKLSLTPKMRRIVEVFDNVSGCGPGDVVTKGEFLQAWRFWGRDEL